MSPLKSLLEVSIDVSAPATSRSIECVTVTQLAARTLTPQEFYDLIVKAPADAVAIHYPIGQPATLGDLRVDGLQMRHSTRSMRCSSSAPMHRALLTGQQRQRLCAVIFAASKGALTMYRSL